VLIVPYIQLQKRLVFPKNLSI